METWVFGSDEARRLSPNPPAQSNDPGHPARIYFFGTSLYDLSRRAHRRMTLSDKVALHAFLETVNRDASVLYGIFAVSASMVFSVSLNRWHSRPWLSRVLRQLKLARIAGVFVSLAASTIAYGCTLALFNMYFLNKPFDGGTTIYATPFFILALPVLPILILASCLLSCFDVSRTAQDGRERR
jgi:hypothetical protein